MKATTIHDFSKDPSIFKYEDVPDPEIKPDHVIVKVAACGINRYDLYHRMGGIRRDITFPHVMGADITGSIAARASDVTTLSEGQPVIVAPGFPTDPADWDYTPINHAPTYTVTGTILWGGYAEYVQIPARFVIPDNTGIAPEKLATLPLCLMTAMHAVKTLGQVHPGTHMLMQAGASGSGILCIQVAKALGAKVITTVGSEEKIETVKSAGADEVILRTQEDQVGRVMKFTDGRGADVVVDNVGSAVFESNMKSLKKGGIFVNFGLVSGYKVDFDLRNFFFSHHTLKGSMMGTMEELHEGLELVRQGKIKPYLDKTFPISDAAAAHEYIESRKVQGSVVLLPG